MLKILNPIRWIKASVSGTIFAGTGSDIESITMHRVSLSQTPRRTDPSIRLLCSQKLICSCTESYWSLLTWRGATVRAYSAVLHCPELGNGSVLLVEIEKLLGDVPFVEGWDQRCAAHLPRCMDPHKRYRRCLGTERGGSILHYKGTYPNRYV